MRDANDTTFEQLLEMLEEALAAWYRGKIVEVPLREPDAILIVAREVKRMQEEARL